MFCTLRQNCQIGNMFLSKGERVIKRALDYLFQIDVNKQLISVNKQLINVNKQLINVNKQLISVNNIPIEENNN